MEFIDVTRDPIGLRRWYDVYAPALTEGQPFTQAWAFEELLEGARFDWPRRRLIHVAGVVDGEIVAAGSIGLPMLDHLRHAFIEVCVHPQRRRLGFGQQMLVHLEELARAEGRSILGAEVAYPLGLPPDGGGWPGSEFARAHGYQFALSDVASTLQLPVAEQTLSEVLPRFTDRYQVLSYRSPGPEWIEHQVSELDATLPTEAPSGDLTLEDEAVDHEADRVAADILAAQRRTKIRTVALLDQTVVGYTDLVHPAYDVGRAYQWGTLVHRDHRGHSLGLRLKVTNLLEFQARFPEPLELLTFNAEQNAHMIAVNERLGFVPVGRLGEFEKQVASAE